MKNLIKFIGKSLLAGSFFMIGALLIYAATISGLGNTIESGDKIGTGWFNEVETSVVPQGGVMAFYGETCPEGWVKADGNGDEIMVDGTLGNLDLRGEFIRGWDDDRGVDNGRVLASLQDHSLQDHRHDFINRLGGRFGGEDLISTSDSNFSYSYNTSYIKEDDGVNISSETRPRNVALLYCVKQ